MTRSLVLPVVLAGALSLGPAPLSAGIIAFTFQDVFNDGIGATSQSFSGSFGYQFQVTGPYPIEIHRVMAFDFDSNGFPGGKARVNFWAEGNTTSPIITVDVLSSASTESRIGTITASTGQTGEFRYVDLNQPYPVLGLGTYRVAVDYYGNSGAFLEAVDSADLTTGDEIAMTIDHVYSLSAGEYPSSENKIPSGFGYFGPNFEYTAVPEPSSLAMLLLFGSVITLLYRRRPERRLPSTA